MIEGLRRSPQENDIPNIVAGVDERALLGLDCFANYAISYLFNYGWIDHNNLQMVRKSIYGQCKLLLNLDFPAGMRPGFFYLSGVTGFESGLAKAEEFRGDNSPVSRSNNLFLDPHLQYRIKNYSGYTEEEKDGVHEAPVIKLALYRDDSAFGEEGTNRMDPCLHFLDTPLIKDYCLGNELLMSEKLEIAQKVFAEKGNPECYQIGYSGNTFFTWKAALNRMLGLPLILEMGWAYTGLRGVHDRFGVFNSFCGQLYLGEWSGDSAPDTGASLSVWKEGG